jgi:hypothetical protein
MIADWYARHGYNFLALSDHNVLSNTVRWIDVELPKRRGGAQALERYRARFGTDWVETREREAVNKEKKQVKRTEVRLKRLDEFRSLVETPGEFLMIQAEEITDSAHGRLPVHINATNVGERIKPQHGKGVQDVMRRNLRAVAAQAERLQRTIVAHLNHPNYGWGVTAEDLAHVVEEQFFEVFNGHRGTRHLGDKLHASVERMWDIANTLRLSVLNAPPLFGIATDDSHHYHGKNLTSTPGRGWIMVQATELSAAAITEAVTRGDFYASTGVTLRSVTFADKTLSIEIEPTGDTKFTTRFIGTRKGWNRDTAAVLDAKGNKLRATKRYSNDVGVTLATVVGGTASYRVAGNEVWVRAVVTSTRAHSNPMFERQLQQAWTQPVGWR